MIFDEISASQSQKEVTANENFEAAQPAGLFGLHGSATTGLTWAYYGGYMVVDGVLTSIASGTVTLDASTTNYVEATRAGVVSKNTTSFTAGRIPLYTVVTGTSTVSSYTDSRAWVRPAGIHGKLTKAMADGNQTLTAAESRNDILECTGALTALRNLVVPLGPQQWTVYANTSGGFGVQVIGATGTGITVADGKRAIVYADGTNVVRVTADT